LKLPPEVNIARKLVDIKNLAPPINISALAKQFAEVAGIDFPADLKVDGVCLNVKSRGKVKIIVNTLGRSAKRIRFTLAHELGHVLIPWHIGSIADQIDVEQSQSGAEYWEIESEANRFASELLMPVRWVERTICNYSSPPVMADIISRTCGVSYQAAVIRLTSLLPRGYVYAATDDRGCVVFGGKSPGTVASAPLRADIIEDQQSRYTWASELWSRPAGDLTYLWWHSKADSTLPKVDGNADWRTRLNDIVGQLNLDEANAKKLKSTISGTIAFANGSIRHDRSPEAVYDACLQRFDSARHCNPLIQAVIYLDGFKSFLSIRAQQLFDATNNEQ
jgi:Zn-dependent peptidase ImmA (M78 family)